MTLAIVPVRRLGPTESAKVLRARLKDAFPAVRFGVRTEHFSMGNAIRVEWTDGPTQARVEEITQGFVNSGFDGMTDSSYAVAVEPQEWKGEFVEASARFVTATRHLSDRLWQRAAEQVARFWGVSPIPKREQAHAAYMDRLTDGRYNGSDDFGTLVYRASRDATAFAPGGMGR